MIKTIPGTVCSHCNLNIKINLKLWINFDVENTFDTVCLHWNLNLRANLKLLINLK